MTSLNRWLDRLQLSPRSQRVLTEAALDWRHDVATAQTLGQCVVAHARGCVSFVRLLGSVLAESALPALHPSWLLCLLIWGAAISLISAPRHDAVFILSARLAVPLAILFGPARRRSPFVGLALAQALISIGVAADLWWQSRSVMFLATFACILAAALADRVRVDVLRERLTVQVAALLPPIWYVGRQLASGLRSSHWSERTIEQVLWIWLTVCLAAMWLWIVRRKETRVWWAHTLQWLEHRAEISR